MSMWRMWREGLIIEGLSGELLNGFPDVDHGEVRAACAKTGGGRAKFLRKLGTNPPTIRVITATAPDVDSR